VKDRKLSWAALVGGMGRKYSLGRPRRKWENDLKMMLEK
jgi:hypothetical protein